jgi:hypothetical protein
MFASEIGSSESKGVPQMGPQPIPGQWSRQSSRRTAFCLGIAILPLLSGCYVFSSFQSASIVPPGVSTYSLAVTRGSELGSEGKDTSGFHWTNYELRARSGSSNDRFDLGMRAVLSHFERDLEIQWALDGRAGLVPQRLTFQLPASMWLGEGGLSTLQLEPTLVASAPLTAKIELNASGSYRVQLEDGFDSYAATLGLALPTPIERVRVRPEIAWLWGVGDPPKSSYSQFGVALELRGKSKESETSDPNEPWW